MKIIYYVCSNHRFQSLSIIDPCFSVFRRVFMNSMLTSRTYGQHLYFYHFGNITRSLILYFSVSFSFSSFVAVCQARHEDKSLFIHISTFRFIWQGKKLPKCWWKICCTFSFLLVLAKNAKSYLWIRISFVTSEHCYHWKLCEKLFLSCIVSYSAERIAWHLSDV